MVASLLKLISSGIQDERLDFKHTLYPFTKVWIKAGRFTTQWGRLDFEQVPTFGNTAYFRILRKGHLVTRLFLVAKMPDIWTPQHLAKLANGCINNAYPRFGWTNSLGHALVEQLTLDIAADRVETIDSRLLEILDEYHTPLEKVPTINELIKRKDHGFTEKSFGWPPPGPQQAPPLGPQPYNETVIVPLPFWFTRGDFGCALPIDAIPMDEIRVGIRFRNLNGLYYTETQLSSNTSTEPGTSLWPISGSNFFAEDPTLVEGQTPLSNTNGIIQMPLNLQLGECYIMAEYVYLDQNEANRFRLADLQIPIVQHYSMKPFQTRKLPTARIRLDIPNPTKDIYFMLNREEAPSYNAYFLGTRDLRGTINTKPSIVEYPKIWWPDALGLYAQNPSIYLRPGFALSDSEPLQGYEVDYEGQLVRFRTQAPALFRSIIPSYEQRKTPWINRYYYNFPLGIRNGFTPFSKPQGEANLDKIVNRELVLSLRPERGYVGGTIVPNYTVYVYAETYNILRIYGGRAGMMFPY
jgi:hypothetical protein